VANELSSWVEGAQKLPARIRRLLADEMTHVHPFRLAAELTCAGLPHLSFNYLRTSIWRAAGLRVGERSRIMGPLHITGNGPWQDRLVIGRGTFLTGPVRIDLGAPVHIGDRVRIGHGVTLLTIDHEIGGPEQRCSTTCARPIRIGDGVWLASGCLILPGVSIGRGAVVAAGAVVTRDVPPDTLVAGMPARVVRSLTQPELHEEEQLELYDRDVAPDSGLRDAQANAETSLSPALRALS
jgi:maltose O-acetyltransferase